MVARTSTKDAATRAQMNASRATVREINTKPLWNEGLKIDVFPGETASDVEWAEGYGNTSVPAKQDPEDDEDKQGQQQQGGNGGGGGGGGGGGQGGKAGSSDPDGKQPKGDAAEAIVLYLNGSRSHPVIISVGDRRHKLVELEEGDVAQYRLRKDRQQMLYSEDGTYISTRTDKVFRVALVPKEEEEEQQQQAPAQQASSGKEQKKKKKYGQKSAKDDNKKSDINIEQNGKATTSQHGEYYATQKTGSDSTTYWQDKKKSTQCTNLHTHIRFRDFRIFNDDFGNFSTTPILIKKDSYCKES